MRHAGPAPKAIRIWPHYFDCSLTRRLGRRLPRSLCVNDPNPREVLKACSELGLECQLIEGKRYPRVWYKGGGLILVATSEKKSNVLAALARALSKVRSRE